MDDFFRFTWTFLLKKKCDICVVLQNFLSYTRTQFDKTVKIIRIYNVIEFLNGVWSNIFNQLGIIYKTTYPYTLQKNGVVERKHRHIVEVDRLIIFQGHIPIKFWGHYALASMYLINWLPSSVINSMTTYDRLYIKKPNIDHLKVIGCLCYAKHNNQHDKLLPRTKTLVHMDYSDLVKDMYYMT